MKQILIGRNEQTAGAVGCGWSRGKWQAGAWIYGQKCLKSLDFTEKINRLQDVTIEISYVNMCGVPLGERHIFATFLAVFA